MRLALLTTALGLALAPSAAAAPFGEVPFRTVSGLATCLRATGLPGELVRSTTTGAQFLQATPAGLAPVAGVARGGSTFSCPQAAARANGAGVVAFAVSIGSEVEGQRVQQGGSSVTAALREPGGLWGAAVKVAEVSSFADGAPIAADISERGDALVAFASSGPPVKISAVRREPGAAFGTPQTLFTPPKGTSTKARVAAGVSASGEAVVAFSFQPAAGRPREVWAAVAAPGAAFGAPVKLGTLRTGAPFSLAVGAGGHALVAFPSGDDLLVAERAPGAGFAPATWVGAASDRVAVYPTAAVGASGEAVVGWQDALAGDVQSVVRSAPGPFGAPVTLVPKSGLKFPKAVLDLFDELGSEDEEVTSGGLGADDDGSVLRALITPDGRALLTAGGIGGEDGLFWSAPRWASVPLAGGVPETQLVGAGLRDASTITPVVSEAGTAGIAWTDAGGGARAGRLHLALEGAAQSADSAVPTVRVTAPKRRVLAADEDLRLKVRCSSACDVRVQLGRGLLAPSETVSLSRAGEKAITLLNFFAPLATLKGGPVKLLVRYGAPGAHRAKAKTVTFTLRRLPDAPLPRVLGPVARRRGNSIVVTWHTDRDADAGDFLVYGTEDRDDPDDPLGSFVAAINPTRSGRRFGSRLDDAKAARYVKIFVRAEGTQKTKTTTVRVRE